MSTLRITLLVSALATAIGMATATSHLQTGTGPGKLTGPATISVNPNRLTLGKTTFYGYTVELNQIVGTDTVVNITDAHGHIGVPSTVTVLAGHQSRSFQASALSVGSDTLTASNANGSASEDITVTE